MGKEIHATINEYLPLRDVVFQTLRQAILYGDLKPGERLMEVHLAERLGVSRTPIREAIRKLELEGLVVMIPRRGAVVASITEKDLKDVLEVRRTLEILACEVACERITPELLKELKTAGEEFGCLKETEDVNRLAEADVRFHEIIYAATGNDRLIHILNNLREQMYRYRVEYLKNDDIYPVLVEEHKKIYEGLKHKDKKMVVELVGCHVVNQEIMVKNIIHKQE